MTNIYELKHTVNFYQKDTDEISLIMFNCIIDTYPHQNWHEIWNNYTKYLSFFDSDEIIIYTILSYKLKDELLTLPEYLIQDLITTLKKYQINPYKLDKIAKFLIHPKISDKIINAYNYYLIKPKYIYNEILNTKNNINKNTLDKLIDSYIANNKLQIFNSNYEFENIYLKLITIANKLNQKIDNINYLLEFKDIKDEAITQRIKKDFAYIETNDKTILEKLEDARIIINNYKYYINSSS